VAHVERPSGIRISGDFSSSDVTDLGTGAPTRGSTVATDPFVTLLNRAGGAISIVDAVSLGDTTTRSIVPEESLKVEVPPTPGLTMALAYDDESQLWSWQLPDVDPEPGAAATFHLQPNRGATRGLIGHALGRIGKFVVLRIGDRVLRKGGQFLAQEFEDRYRRGGLRWFGSDVYRIALPDIAQQFQKHDLARLAAGRSLLMLHGTMSLSHTGLAAIPTDLMRRLEDHYQGRVWAFDQHTLSVTPRDNAELLIERLRDLGAGTGQVEVDIIAHSRGGLVARELAERLTDDSPVRVGKVLFVATPNFGTPLCDPGHIGDLVDNFTNLFAFFPDNPVSAAIDAVATVMASVAMKAATGLVGLTAMDPKGSYLAELNASRPRPDTYFALGSNYEPQADTAVGIKLRNLAADKIIGPTNDLIVPTDSVWGVPGSIELIPKERQVICVPPTSVDHSGFWRSTALDDAVGLWFGTSTREFEAIGSRSFVIQPEPMPVIATPETQVVKVSVSHCSCEFAKFPVIVGHFAGTPIGGAEKFLDDRTGFRLSAQFDRGAYPQHLGESHDIDLPLAPGDDRGYPTGVIVVGLGPPDELRKQGLVHTMYQAMLRRAGRKIDDAVLAAKPAGSFDALKFSVVGVGTVGPGGLSTDSLVSGVLDAATAVNDQLTRLRDPADGGTSTGSAWDRVRITEIEFVDVYADRAEAIASSLQRWEGPPSGTASEFDVNADVAYDETLGGLPPQTQADAADPDWLRVIIRSPSREREARARPDARSMPSRIVELEYTAIGRRARADRLLSTVDAATIDDLLDATRAAPGRGSSDAHTLFELLIPSEFKDELSRGDNLQLIVDEHTADIPWEALAIREAIGSTRELAGRGGLLRQFREAEALRHIRRPPTGNNVLVIGNPPSEGPNLLGAADEAESVLDAFTDFSRFGLVWTDGKLVTTGALQRTGRPGRVVLNALFEREWKVIHLAAHGRFDPSDPSRSGVLIDKEITLTANVVRQLSAVPELVFLNCCHLARQEESLGAPDLTFEPGRLAASVSRELMRVGVVAVIAAGWAVDDAAAETFARTFYEHLTSGEAYGDAVRAARRATRQRHPESLTWAAYQCYGDRSYRLRGGATGRMRVPMAVSESERRRRIRAIGVQASRIGIRRFRSNGSGPALADIQASESRYRKDLDDFAQLPNVTALMWYELGLANAELGRHADAVRWYRNAWHHEQASTVPVQVLEQLGTAELRLAFKAWLALGKKPNWTGSVRIGDDYEPIDMLIAAAQSHLYKALALGTTTDRLALVGRFHARRASMATNGERGKDLDLARKFQGMAHRLALGAPLIATMEGEDVGDIPLDGTSRGLKPRHVIAWILFERIGSGVEPLHARDFLAAIESRRQVAFDADGTLRQTDPSDAAEPTGSAYDADTLLTRVILDQRGTAGVLAAAYDHAFATRFSRSNVDVALDTLRQLNLLTKLPVLDELVGKLEKDWAPKAEVQVRE
jgi:hypothetical protein